MAGVRVRLTNPPIETITDGNGTFAFTSVPTGPLQLEPSSSLALAISPVSASDAVAILQYLVGMRSLDAAALLAADVNASGQVTAADAALVLQYVVGAIGAFPAASHCGSPWIFLPLPDPLPNQQLISPQPSAVPCIAGAIAYTPLLEAAGGQNFIGIFLGDVNGSWQASSTLAIDAPVRLHRGSPRLTRRGRTMVHRFPYNILSPVPFTALEVSIRYEPAALQAVRARLTGDARAGTLLAQRASGGHLRIAAARSQPFSGPVTLWIEIESTARALAPHLFRLESIQAE